MPLSALSSSQSGEVGSGAASGPGTNQQTVVNNQNLLHVKFHVNKFQDNLLSKRLQQLNVEEMKQRLKHQRTSNELVVFLKECQQSTGYLAKMKQIDNNESHVDSTLRDNHTSTLSNAVKNMINASILVVDTKHFESKSCQDYASLKSGQQRRSTTAYLNLNAASKKISRKNSKIFRRTRSQSGHHLEGEQFLQNSTPMPPPDDENGHIHELVEETIGQDADRRTTTVRNSKSATVSRSQAFPVASEHISSVKIPLFEHILLNSNSSPINSAKASTSKAYASSRSDSSTFSNSSESLSDINTKENVVHQRIRPITSNVVRTKRKPLEESQKKVSSYEKSRACSHMASMNFANSTTVSNLDWFTTDSMSFGQNPTNSNKCETTSKTSASTITNLFTKNPNSSSKSKKILKKSSQQQSSSNQPDFKSRSLNFLLSSNLTFNTAKSHVENQVCAI